MNKIPGALALLLFAIGPVLAQNCSLDGSVTNSVTHAPILRAHISVVGADDPAFADTDANGRWRIGQMACGRVSITAVRPGFLRMQQTPTGNQTGTPSVLLVAGTPLHDIKVELAPQAVLAGRVLDDQGDPILGAQVSLMTTRIINGVRGIQASSSTNTNDLGEYRFAGLAAGRYFLCANAGGGGVVASGTAPFGERCYPGPVSAGVGTAMEVQAGYEGRIDFPLAPLATFHVNGVVSGQTEGVPTSVNLTPRAQLARMFLGLSAQVRPDGTFSIRNVPPGSYTITARSTQVINRRMMARADIDVGGSDLEGVQLHLESGVTVTGTLRAASASGKKPERQQYTLLLRGVDGAAGPGISGWDETRTSFSVADVMPGMYRLEFVPPAPFYLKSATLGGRDMVSSEVAIGSGASVIEVVISDDGGVVEGDVSAEDAPVAAWIFLQKDGMPSRNARADAMGRFRIEGLPPGDYRAYAWDDNTKVEYANPEWMQRNGKGVAVSVAAGQTAEVKLVRQVAPSE